MIDLIVAIVLLGTIVAHFIIQFTQVGYNKSVTIIGKNGEKVETTVYVPAGLLTTFQVWLFSLLSLILIGLTFIQLW